jgi:hypothetical protein
MSASITAGSASVTRSSVSVMAADAAACSSRSFEVQLLAGRVEACAEQVAAVQARLAQLQLMDWQSPAGLAYRSSLREQAVALCRAWEGVHAAALALRRHSVRVAASALPAAGGY